MKRHGQTANGSRKMPKQMQFGFPDSKPPTLDQLLSVDEIFESATVSLLLRLHEDNRIEWKEPGIHRNSVAEYFSMWANTAPQGGILVIGLSDKGTIVGCKKLNQTALNDIETAGRELCPLAKFTPKRIDATNASGEADFLILYRVEYDENRLIETVDKRAFRRIGSSKFAVPDDEKKLLQQDKGQCTIELDPCGLSYPDDFVIEEVKAFVRAIQVKKKLAERPLVEVLVRHKLGKQMAGKFVPNVACALLFAKDPRDVVPGAMIRFHKYEGIHAMTGEKRNVVKDEEITGTIPHMIADSAAIVSQHIREYSILGQDGKFQTVPDYPPFAWYEAIVNACVHRSYELKGMNIFVRMFDDRIEIESPGGFLPLVTPETIYEFHNRRNYWLMDALHYLDLVKCENEGTKRMRESMEARGLPPPMFEQKQINGGTVRVTLRKAETIKSEGLSEQSGGLQAQSGGLPGKVMGSDESVFADFDESVTPSTLPEEVEERMPVIAGKNKRPAIRRAILELCSWRPLMPTEIAYFLKKKSVKRLVEDYISPMHSEGVLERTIPDNPAHPAQKYSTTAQGTTELLVPFR